MKMLTYPILPGKHIRLEPLRAEHRSGMQAAANDPKLWEVTVTRGYGEFFDGWWEAAERGQAAGTSVPYAVIHQTSGEVIGSTSYLNLALADDRLEIGSTWYARTYHGTAVNPESKLLLMRQAFEVMGIKRVEFCVDAINSHSRAAVTKLGATQEGILRSHRWTQTRRRRDTVIFSVLDTEWAEVKRGLEGRLGK
ncbi:MAG: GNAT family protein [Gemmatales bacterium]